MPPRQRDVQPVTARSWDLPTQDLLVHHGLHPLAMPWGSFQVAAGLDGRVDGCFRKLNGTRLWGDMAQVAGGVENYYSDVLVNAIAFGAGEANWYKRSYYGCWPFRIRITNGDGYVYGFVFETDPDLGGTRSWWLVYKVEGVHTASDPVGTQLHLMGIPFYQGNVADPTGTGWIAPVGARGASSFEDQVTSVVSNGRFLYIFCDSRTPGLSAVLWYDATHPGPGAPAWEVDWFGIPKPHWEDPVNLGLTCTAGAVVPGGFAYPGQYTLRHQLVDTLRGRLSNVSNQTNPRPMMAMYDYTNVICGALQQNFALPSPYFCLDGYGRHYDQIADHWTRYRIWSTLYGGLAGGPPPETYFFADEMNLYTDWNGGDNSNGGGAGILTRTYVMTNANRTDNTDAAAGPDDMPYTDDTLSGQPRFNWLSDVYRHRYSSTALGEAPGTAYLEVTHAACRAFGLTFLAIEEADGTLNLCWSVTGSVDRPENIPIGNKYKLSYTKADTLAFTQTRDTLYLFGDGAVYAIQRNGTYVVVREILTGFTPVSKWAVTAVGSVVFAVTKEGAWLLDAQSDAPIPVKSLERVVRDRWANSTLLGNVSVAYDEDLDVVVVLCPGAAQACLVWFSADRITMLDGCNFTWARELDTPDDSGIYRKRAMLIGQSGKIVHLAGADDIGALDGTMHGQRSAYAGYPTRWAWRVKAAAAEVKAERNTTKLTLETEAGVAAAFTAQAMSGSTVGFLSGALRGQIRTCPGYRDATVGPDVWVLGDVTASVAVGDWISLSPIPVTLVGAPFEGTTGRLWDERKILERGQLVMTRLVGTDVSLLANGSLFRAGVATTPGVMSGEPTPTPTYWLAPDVGALPRWLNQAATGVYLSDLPAAGTVPSVDQPGNNLFRIGDELGVGGLALYPVLTSDWTGARMDLLNLLFSGRILPVGTTSEI